MTAPTPQLITLRTLGGIGLTAADGRELDGLLRQPKRFGLLVYLASPAPGTWHRRDSILGVFWPEFQTAQARTALRNALYVIRQELGPEIIRARGDEEVSIDPSALRSDVASMQAHLGEGRLAEGIALHTGEFLPGMFIADAGEFDRWLDDERQRLWALVVKALGARTRELAIAGDFVAAAEHQQQIVARDPDDELATRQLIQLLDRAGDRGQALATFDRFAARLRESFGAEPTADTVNLVNEIRARRAPQLADDAVAVDTVPAGAPVLPEPSVRRRRSRDLWLIGGAVALGAVALLAYSSRTRPPNAIGPANLLVLPMENATGDRQFDYVATGLAEEVAIRLATMKTLVIRSAARATWPMPVRDSLDLIGKSFGTTLLLRSRLQRVGDSLQAEAELVDLKSGQVKNVGVDRFIEGALHDAGSRFAAAIAGAIYRVPLPEVPHVPAHHVDPESFRLMMAGWHQLLGATDNEGARQLFLRATEIDRLHARAWSGLSSTLAAAVVNGLAPFEEGSLRAEAAARRAIELDSLEGTAWANLGVLQALRHRDYAAGDPYFQRAIAVEPANPEVYLVQSAALRFAGQWDRSRDAIRIARQLDPLSATYAANEANGALCNDRPEDALRMFRAAVYLDPQKRDGQLGVAISLARLNQWEQAIGQLRMVARARGDTGLANTAPEAHGPAGYWRLKHAEGELLLTRRKAIGQKGWIADYLIGVAEIGAGHTDRGFELLESELQAGSRMMYKLRCNPEVDEVRATPRFQRLIAAAGSTK